MPVLQGFGRGDHRVLVNVIVPRHLTDEQRRLLEEFDAAARRTTPTRRTRASSTRCGRRSADGRAAAPARLRARAARPRRGGAGGRCSSSSRRASRRSRSTADLELAAYADCGWRGAPLAGLRARPRTEVEPAGRRRGSSSTARPDRSALGRAAVGGARRGCDPGRDRPGPGLRHRRPPDDPALPRAPARARARRASSTSAAAPGVLAIAAATPRIRPGFRRSTSTRPRSRRRRANARRTGSRSTVGRRTCSPPSFRVNSARRREHRARACGGRLRGACNRVSGYLVSERPDLPGWRHASGESGGWAADRSSATRLLSEARCAGGMASVRCLGARRGLLSFSWRRLDRLFVSRSPACDLARLRLGRGGPKRSGRPPAPAPFCLLDRVSEPRSYVVRG